jgi:hypothetical protein
MSRQWSPRTRRRRLVASIVALAGTGCSALLELDPHLERSDAGVVDAAAADVAASDATLDAVPSADARELADGGPLPAFCDGPDAGWRYCDSFDLGTTPSSFWGADYPADGGASVGLGSPAFSPPRALMASTPSATPTVFTYAYLYRDTPIVDTLSEIDLVFQLNLNSIGTQAQSDLVQLVFAKGAYVFTLRVAANTDALVFEKQKSDGGATSTAITPLSGKFRLATWTKVDIRLVFKPVRHFRVEIDGVPSSGDLPFLIPPTLGTILKVEVGLPYSEGKWTVLMDDLALRVLL